MTVISKLFEIEKRISHGGFYETSVTHRHYFKETLENPIFFKHSYTDGEGQKLVKR